MQVRPSELYGISDEVPAFYFDRAITTFGIEVEHDLDEYTKDEKKPEAAKTKRERRFALWMNQTPTFRDPAGG